MGTLNVNSAHVDGFRGVDGRLASNQAGGCPVYYLTKDGGILCSACANGDNGSRSADSDLDPDCPDDDQWIVTDGQAHYEGSPVVCDHCYAEIKSVYGDVS